MSFKKKEYLNAIWAFDTETTSYTTWATRKKKDGTEERYCSGKYAWAYIMDFCKKIGDSYFHYTFRKWEEVRNFLDELSSTCSKNEYYVIYVHNLSFEFQFMKDWLELTQVFARKSHNVLRCVYKHIEFRDSLALANLKLASLAHDEKLPVQKAEGDLKYEVVRHWSTPLDEKEMGYIYKDTEVVCEYIAKKLQEYGNYSEIPMTSTGEVRALFRRELGPKLEKVHQLAVKYSAHTPELQNLFLKIYAGAYTHANYQIIEQVVDNLECWDIASSYPYQMVARKYPTVWFKFNQETVDSTDNISILQHLLKNYPPEEYAWAMDVEFTNLTAKHCHNTLSHHKAFRISSDCVCDNGRVFYARFARYCLNEVDMDIVREFYNWSDINFKSIWISRKSYLPKELVSVILKLFEQKTSLKGQEDEYTNYMRSKNRINGVYGMTVFDILNTGFYFDEESNARFLREEKDFEDFQNYVKNPKNYLWYSIGVWVTSYARRQILSPIAKMGENACYCDTDSVKFKNGHRYRKLLSTLNAQINREFNDAMKYHKFAECEYRFFTTEYTDDKGKFHPREEKFMGIFEVEKPYKRFKTLGSKRYLVEYYDGKMEATVAGAPKYYHNEQSDTDIYFVDALMNGYDYSNKDDNEYNRNTYRFDNFTNDFVFKNCKLTHTYCECNKDLFIRDYLGNLELQPVRAGVCLTRTDFSMRLSEAFFLFLEGRIEFSNKDIYKYFRPHLYPEK